MAIGSSKRNWNLKRVKKSKIATQPTGQNFLLLHAYNVGKRPPNTIGVKYKYRGETKEIILKSDYNTSELIEIKLVDKL